MYTWAPRESRLHDNPTNMILAPGAEVPAFYLVPLCTASRSVLNRHAESLMSFVTSLADSAVGRAFIEHGQDLFRFLSKRRRSALQDHRLAQETYARLVRMPTEDLTRDPQSYLFRVAGNLLHEFELDGRSESTARRLWKAEALSALNGRANDCAVDDALRGVRVREILKELSPLSRAALVLHRRDGLSYEQIADQVGVSPLRVRQAFAQGLQHFCRRLQDNK